MKSGLHFAHANGFPAGSYKKFLRHFEPQFNVAALEKYAHDERYPLKDNWDNQVHEMIDYIQYQFDKPVVAIGHSFGGVISYMAACTQPNLFKALILLDPPLILGVARHFFKFAKSNALIDMITPAKKTKFRNREWPEEQNLVDYFASRKLFENIDKDCIHDYVESVTEVKNGKRVLTFAPDIEAAIFRTIPDNLNRFSGKLVTPTVLMTAKNTNVCVPSLYGPFLRHNPIIRHRVFARGGHMFPLEYPDALAEQIMQLLPELSV
ncbi:MAG: alpha/beta hydrolase [Pseudomonadota bacterium]